MFGGRIFSRTISSRKITAVYYKFSAQFKYFAQNNSGGKGVKPPFQNRPYLQGVQIPVQTFHETNALHNHELIPMLMAIMRSHRK